MSESVVQPRPQASATSPPPPADEPYNHSRWLKAFDQPGPDAPRLPFTNMERDIMRRTAQRVNFQTGETFVTAKPIAREKGHETTNKVLATWKKAYRLGVMSEPYTKPNEPLHKKFRRLLMPSSWRPDASPEPGEDDSNGVEASPELGEVHHPNRVKPSPKSGDALNKDRSPQLSLYQNNEQDQIDPSSFSEAQGEGGSIAPSEPTTLTAMSDQIVRSMDAEAAVVIAELGRRGVTRAGAENFVGRFDPPAIRQQLVNFDRQRLRILIKNPDAWFQAALTNGYQPAPAPTAPASAPAYAHQNQQNRKLRAECNALERQIDQTRIAVATMPPGQRRKLLRRVVERDVAMALQNYRKSKGSLLSDAKRTRDAGRDPFSSPRVLAAIAELLEGGLK